MSQCSSLAMTWKYYSVSFKTMRVRYTGKICGYALEKLIVKQTSYIFASFNIILTKFISPCHFDIKHILDTKPPREGNKQSGTVIFNSCLSLSTIKVSQRYRTTALLISSEFGWKSVLEVLLEAPILIYILLFSFPHSEAKQA